MATEKPVSIGHDLTSGLLTNPKPKVDSMETLLLISLCRVPVFLVWPRYFGSGTKLASVLAELACVLSETSVSSFEDCVFLQF